MTYIVFSGMLNPTQSIYLISWWVFVYMYGNKRLICHTLSMQHPTTQWCTITKVGSESAVRHFWQRRYRCAGTLWLTWTITAEKFSLVQHFRHTVFNWSKQKFCQPHWHFAPHWGWPHKHIWFLSQGRINWEGCSRKGIQCKYGDDGGGSLIGPDGVVPIRIVGVCLYYLVFACTIKSRRRFLLALAHLCIPKNGRQMVVCVWLLRIAALLL